MLVYAFSKNCVQQCLYIDVTNGELYCILKPCDREEDASLESLVLEPGWVLGDGGMCGQQQRHPLRHPGRGGQQPEPGLRGEAGAERGQDGHLGRYYRLEMSKDLHKVSQCLEKKVS